MSIPRNKTLLFAEDEPELLEIYSDWFMRLGYQVLCAKNGNEALALCREQHVDLVISDVRMADCDGIELARRMQTSLDCSPLLVFLTGFADLSLEEAYDLGACAILSKPIQRGELETAVARFVNPPHQSWTEPPPFPPEAVVQKSYYSMESALERRELNFGRGGMFVRGSGHLPDDIPLSFQFHFKKGHAARMEGSGILRWQRETTQQDLPPGVGIEILHLARQSMNPVLEWISRTQPRAFIPRQ